VSRKITSEVEAIDKTYENPRLQIAGKKFFLAAKTVLPFAEVEELAHKRVTITLEPQKNGKTDRNGNPYEQIVAVELAAAQQTMPESAPQQPNHHARVPVTTRETYTATEGKPIPIPTPQEYYDDMSRILLECEVQATQLARKFENQPEHASFVRHYTKLLFDKRAPMSYYWSSIRELKK